MQGSLELLSPALLSIIVAAAILLGALRGVARQLAFLALNLVFLAFCLLGLSGTAIAVCFSAAGYLLVRRVRTGPGWAFAAGIAAFVLLFVYMKRYAFLDALLPSAVLTSALSTVGLSFLFFKILHIAVDAQSGTLGALDGLTYINYCTNFATFTMGPIQRYQDHRDQWADETSVLPFEHYVDAVIRILVGLVKAYVFAAWLQPHTLPLTWGSGQRSLPQLLFAIYAFNLYLYLNFAGYCDVMIGAGTLFGVRAPENFDKPFLARNIAAFWQRQHRSLTLWLTDYVFTPTYKRLLKSPGLATHPLLAVNISLMLTMIVSGLWHGTTVAFLVFGLVHGVYLVVYRTWDTLAMRMVGRKRLAALRNQVWARALGVLITFNAVSFSFVFFVLDTTAAMKILGQLFSP